MLRGFDLKRLDLLVAGVLAAASAAVYAEARQPWWAIGCGVLGAATVATRRRAPIVSGLVIAAVTIVLGVADRGVDQTAQAIAAGLCFYMLGCSAGPRSRWLLDVALLALAAVAVSLTNQPTALDVAGTWVTFIVLPYVAGRTIESRRGLTSELEQSGERARREQEARARRAAAEERTRIARELHDVVAHSLSVMVIQTVAAREVARTDPASAHAALAAVQSSGREALLEMRRMVGVLRRGDVELAGSVTPGLAQLDLLAQRARMSGLPVEVVVRGQRRVLPEAVDLVAFRIVQEALTNAIKHAGPARASVTVAFGDQSLELEICDDGCGLSPDDPLDNRVGHGLVGMRERVALFDGELATGAAPGGGFRVRARVPVMKDLAA